MPTLRDTLFLFIQTTMTPVTCRICLDNASDLWTFGCSRRLLAVRLLQATPMYMQIYFISERTDSTYGTLYGWPQHV